MRLHHLNFFRFLFLGICGLIFYFIILDPSRNFLHEEEFSWISQIIGDDGVGWGSKDFRRIINPNMEASSRTRQLSWLFLQIDTKFRYYLFNFLPFHPSISLTWIFTFLLSPLLLAGVMKNITQSPRAALISVSIFISSMGFLSTNTQYFHAAKPMTIFFTLLMLFSSSKLQTLNSLPSKSQTTYFAGIFFSLLLGSFFDETFYFAYVIFPILFFPLLQSRKTRKMAFFVWLSPLFLSLMIITFILPVLAQGIGAYYNFWEYAVIYNPQIKSQWLPQIPSVLWNLFLAHFYPLFWQTSIWIKAIFALAWSAIGVIFLWKIPNKEFSLVKKIIAIIFLYTIFLSLILTRREGASLSGTYYWGNTGSLIIAICLGAIMGTKSGQKKIILSFLITTLICGLSLSNFVRKNDVVLNHMLEYQPYKSVETKIHFSNNIRYSWSDILEVWKNRQNREAVIASLQNKPKSLYWTYHLAKLYWQKRQ